MFLHVWWVALYIYFNSISDYLLFSLANNNNLFRLFNVIVSQLYDIMVTYWCHQMQIYFLYTHLDISCPVLVQRGNHNMAVSILITLSVSIKLTNYFFPLTAGDILYSWWMTLLTEKCPVQPILSSQPLLPPTLNFFLSTQEKN